MPEWGMPRPSVHTPVIPLMSLDSPSDNAVNSLYRAALGPVNTERYIPAFARLDAVGRTLTSWHWAACFFTLGWMVFRRLWGAALVYVAAAEGVALLVFGLGRPLLQWPQAVEWGVMGAFVVVSSVVPGLYAHAILHADIRKRVTKALAASANIPEACDLLARQAVSRKRLTWVIGGHVLIAAAGLLAYGLFPQGMFAGAVPSAAPPSQTPPSPSATWNTPAPTLASSRPAASAAGSEAHLRPVAGTPAEAPSAATPPPSGEDTTPANPAAAIAPAPDSASAVQPSPVAGGPVSAGQTSGKASAATATVSHRVDKPTKQAARALDKANTTPGAKTPAPATAASSKPDSVAKTAAAVRGQPPARGGTAASDAPLGSAPGFYINVGLFADEGNARKAQSRLLNEGLPAFRQTLEGAKGARTRVRVGPFASRADAETAASAVRALELEAVVFQK